MATRPYDIRGGQSLLQWHGSDLHDAPEPRQVGGDLWQNGGSNGRGHRVLEAKVLHGRRETEEGEMEFRHVLLGALCESVLFVNCIALL